MDVPRVPAAAEMLWRRLRWRHRAAWLVSWGNFFCSLTSGTLPVEVPHVTHLALMPNSTDPGSLSPRRWEQNQDRGREREAAGLSSRINKLRYFTFISQEHEFLQFVSQTA